MADTYELVQKLKLNSNSLSKCHRRIAQYIENHYEKAAFMTAAALGKECGISESTVIRFAVSLGYDGYPEMREALSGLVRQRLTSEQRFEMTSELELKDLPEKVLKNDAQNIRRTMEALSRETFHDAVHRLLKARKVYVLGLRSASPMAQFLYLYLHQILDDVVLIQSAVGDVFEEIAQIGSGDVLVGISYPRYSTRTVECMRYARENGAETIALTDSEHSPLYKISDVCLCASTDMTSFVDSLAAPLSVINALIVSLGLHRKEKLVQHFQQLEGIWNAHRVYINEENE